MTDMIEDLRRQLAELTARVAELEEERGRPATKNRGLPPVESRQAAPQITEDELLAISGALAAYLGLRVRIRQIRLISSRAWAQQGRATIQASHRLHT